MMYSQGIVLLGHPDSGGTSSISFLVSLCGGSTYVAGSFLFLTLPLSLSIFISDKVLPLIPQLLVSLIFAVGSLMVIINGVFADGYVPKGGSWFIYNDQIMIVVMMLIHFYSVIYYVKHKR
jgi:hypothetical protein